MEKIAVLRAEWLAQLAEAIEGAQRLAWQLGTRQSTSAEARELYGKLEAARLELDSIRGLASGRAFDLEPDWMQMLGWSAPAADPE
jgi:hypothetical protein